MSEAVAEVLPDDETGTDIVAVVSTNPAIVLLDKAKFSEFYERMKAETDAFVPDISTDKGRKAIAALAYKVARTKTAIDDAGKKLNEEARAKINIVDEARRIIRDQLDNLKDEVRRPLTEWESAEEARIDACKRMIAWLGEQKIIQPDDTASDVEKRAQAVAAAKLDPNGFGEMLATAEVAQADAMETLKRAFDRLTKEEADRAELERLRAAEAERNAREQKERDEAEARSRAEAEAKAEEERRAEAARQEEMRIQRAKDEAAEAARREAARKAQAEIDAANERARQAEAAAQAERDRIAREQRERDEAAERERQAVAKREADQKHRAKIMGEAKAAIITCGVDEETARKIVLAIRAGEVPHVSIAF